MRPCFDENEIKISNEISIIKKNNSLDQTDEIYKLKNLQKYILKNIMYAYIPEVNTHTYLDIDIYTYISTHRHIHLYVYIYIYI